MSLRVHAAPNSATKGLAPTSTPTGDDWGTRIAKLVPAEALGLYGSAVALAPPPGEPNRLLAQWIIVAVCLIITVIVRFRATADAAGRPQIPAIVLAVISFLIWLMAIGEPTSPFPLPDSFATFGPLAALLWGSLVPFFYKGD